jgi:hypothetical protein
LDAHIKAVLGQAKVTAKLKERALNIAIFGEEIARMIALVSGTATRITGSCPHDAAPAAPPGPPDPAYTPLPSG